MILWTFLYLFNYVIMYAYNLFNNVMYSLIYVILFHFLLLYNYVIIVY